MTRRARKTIGRPKVNLSAKDRKTVRAAAGYGLKDEQIAILVDVSEATLKRYCAVELASGRVNASAQVQQTAFQMAKGGKTPAMTIFWLKCRAGWKEAQAIELSGRDGKPIETIVRVVRVPVAPPKRDADD